MKNIGAINITLVYDKCYSFIVIVIFYSLYAQVPWNFLYVCYICEINLLFYKNIINIFLCNISMYSNINILVMLQGFRFDLINHRTSCTISL